MESDENDPRAAFTPLITDAVTSQSTTNPCSQPQAKHLSSQHCMARTRHGSGAPTVGHSNALAASPLRAKAKSAPC